VLGTEGQGDHGGFAAGGQQEARHRTVHVEHPAGAVVVVDQQGGAVESGALEAGGDAHGAGVGGDEGAVDVGGDRVADGGALAGGKVQQVEVEVGDLLVEGDGQAGLERAADGRLVDGAGRDEVGPAQVAGAE